MKRLRLSTQVNVIFTVVTLLTSTIFLFALSQVFDAFRAQQNKDQLNGYFLEVINEPSGKPRESQYNGYIIFIEANVRSQANIAVLDGNFFITDIYTNFAGFPPGRFERDFKVGSNRYYFQIERIRLSADTFQTIVVFTGEDYLAEDNNQYNTLVRLSFISLVLLGNAIILLWSRVMVDRIRLLQKQVKRFQSSHYENEIDVHGRDEISELAQTIEEMRVTILENEKTKQEMLQNVSHDFKTPIAVIQSYAEAIIDGVSPPEEAETIIKQSKLLNQKVKQLLQFNRLEFLTDERTLVEVQIDKLLAEIVKEQRYRSQLTIEFVTQPLVLMGTKEGFETIFTNIIDNAFRYAKTRIVVTIGSNGVTIFNDGPNIDEAFLKRMFQPYEKGHRGQFGLGMSIAYRMAKLFSLTLRVENQSKGVSFNLFKKEKLDH